MHPTISISASRANVQAARFAELLRLAMSSFGINDGAVRQCLHDAYNLVTAASSDLAVATASGRLQRGGLTPRQVSAISARIEATLGSPIQVAHLSAAAGLSVCYFSRAFKVSFGLTPGYYICVRRVERAKLMMVETGDSMAQIAAACGFSDQSHLCRRFRSIVGISPGAWRRLQ